MTTSSKPKSSWRDLLAIHPACEALPLLTPDELRALAEDIKVHGLIHQPVVQRLPNGGRVLLDGRHRLDALELLGMSCEQITNYPFLVLLNAKGDDAGDDLAYAHIISVNIRRRHLNVEDRQNLLVELIALSPERSNRQIAEGIGVDHKAVGRARAKAEQLGRIPQLTKTIGKDGKARKHPAHKATTRPAAPPKPTTDSDHVETAPEPIQPAFDKIVTKCVADVADRIGAALDQLDDIEIVMMLERLQAVVSGLLVTAIKRAVESILGEGRKAASPDCGIPEFVPHAAVISKLRGG